MNVRVWLFLMLSSMAALAAWWSWQFQWSGDFFLWSMWVLIFAVLAWQSREEA